MAWVPAERLRDYPFPAADAEFIARISGRAGG
jgi:hypothetical protein